jgi:DNA double-strand break repair helicase HerA and related ATPase
MTDSDRILLGAGTRQVFLEPRYANRHGLIAGATGTGKTITLQVLAESFSRIGVPVFVSDVKGDLSGISLAGSPSPKIDARVEKIGITNFRLAAAPTVFWDLFGVQGHPVRATVSDLGPLLLARLLDLNDTQEGVLTVAFEFADDEGLLLLDMNDLRSTLQYVGDNAGTFASEYGNVSKQSVGAILRRLLVIEREGGDQFFGEPALDLHDMIRVRPDGSGQVNVLAADRLMNSPRVYSTFLLWLLSELFENLPEVGDVDKPRFVFFFDEAHLLFKDAPKALLEKVEQVVRLIRSKGVGVYFVTQNPLDVPDSVLGQLGNRVQHALRAFTPKDQKAVRAAAQTFRTNPQLDTEKVITELGVGEALVSVLQEGGVPSMVDRTLLSPPCSHMGAITAEERRAAISSSPLAGRYDKLIDRESAHELLRARAEKAARQAQERDSGKAASAPKKPGSRRQSVGEAFIKSLARTVGSQIGRQIMRGILGSLRR